MFLPSPDLLFPPVFTDRKPGRSRGAERGRFSQVRLTVKDVQVQSQLSRF